MSKVTPKPDFTGPIADSKDWDFAGCYALFQNADCLYIGATWRRIGIRIKETIRRLGIKPDRAEAWRVPHSMFDLERELIQALNPIINSKRPMPCWMAAYKGQPCLIVGREGKGRVRIQLDSDPRFQKTVMAHTVTELKGKTLCQVFSEEEKSKQKTP